MTRTPEALAPLPAGPPWMIQPGYPVPSHPVYPPSELPAAPPAPPPVRPARLSVFALTRAALIGVYDSFRYLFGL